MDQYGRLIKVPWVEVRGARRGRAFTLIELLVVISIISLLVAILLPSLKRSREQAKAAVCLANLKGISNASHVYATGDQAEIATPVHPRIWKDSSADGAYEWGGKSGVGGSPAGVGISGSTWGTAAGRGPASRGLNRVMYKGVFADYANDPGPDERNWRSDASLELGSLRCPSDRGYTGQHFSRWRESKLSSYDHYGNSYAASTLWLGVPGGGCRLLSNAPHLRALSRVPNPANTQFYLENCGRFAWRADMGKSGDGCSSLQSGGCHGQSRPVTGWHGRNWEFQASFVDGHASLVRMHGRQTPAPKLSHYPAWGGNPTTHAIWKCTMVRGKGWQIDTLPAPPVGTAVSCVSANVVIQPLF